MTSEQPVIVVGAGISGLCAAKCLQRAGVNCLVLEARDRVGGRTWTKEDAKVKYVDVGGAYVGPSQDRLLRVAKELGIETYKVNETEDLLHYKNGRRTRFRTVPWLRNPFTNMDVSYVLGLMDKMGKEIPVDAPWDAPHAEEWDTMTYKAFLEKYCWTRNAIEYLSQFSAIVITSEAYECSLLSLLWYVKQCGGMKRIFSTTNGGQERKFLGGSQQISKKLAASLGDAVQLQKPVVSIRQDTNEVIVKTLDGKEYTGRYVIMAIPPAVQMKIHYEPSLPPLRHQLLQRLPMGSVIKCAIYYPTRFWASKGLCGSLLIEGEDHPAFLTLDDTRPDGSYPGITAFICADKARRLCNRTSEERKHLLSKSLATAMDCPEALTPSHYVDKVWMEEQYSGGCYTSMYPPGLLTRYGRVLREPIGRMFFAGTETATQWSGYMEGAIQAGERAAREVLCDMGKISCSEIWLPEPPSKDVIPKPFDITWKERLLPSVAGFLRLLSVSGTITVASVACFYCHKHMKR